MRGITHSLGRHREFIGHVVTMMSGRSIAAAIALFTMPIVSRLFTPEHFGVAAVFVSIVGIATLVASLKYEAAVALPEEDSEALDICRAACWVAFGVSLGLLFVVAALQVFAPNLAIVEMLSVWAWVIPLAVFLQACVSVQENWLSRKRRFKQVSGSMVLGNTMTGVGRIGLGYFLGSSVFGLIIGYLAGTVSRLVAQMSRDGGRGPIALDRTSIERTIEVARNYRDFPRLNAPAALIFSLGSNLPVLFFATMFSPATAGLFAMANRLVQVPTTIMATSVKRVFLQKAARIDNSGRSLRKAFLLTVGGLAAMAIPPVLVMWLYGEPILGWLLGDHWRKAGHFLEILAPWIMSIWVTAPANAIFVVLRKQKFWLALQSCLTSLRLLAFGLAYYYSWSADLTLQVFVLMSVAGNLLSIGTAIRIINRHPGAVT